jgi:hypothetical protein
MIVQILLLSYKKSQKCYGDFNTCKYILLLNLVNDN